jgi:chromosomal replication initiator protein
LEENVKPQTYRTWFNDSHFVSLKDNLLTVKVQTDFAANYLNKNYNKLIQEILESMYNEEYQIRFVSRVTDNSKKIGEKEKTFDLDNPNHQLRDRYTFDDFVIGKNNNFAYSAAMGVAENPGRNYNPLFIYGESGMGKTHLMQAIGNFALEGDDDVKVYYTTTETFTNEMIEAIQTNNMHKFRAKYRNVDILLVDDIHFLSRKEGTQEEFFHTFNALLENKKQIVLTSDRPPKDIADLEKRLVTRFESGLLADLKSPDFETRVAILRKKIETENFFLPDDVTAFIAESIYTSVRALEGSLIRIIAHTSFNKINPEEITVDMVSKVLSDLISEKKQEITLDKIVEIVTLKYGVSKVQLLDKTRKKNIAFPRHVAMYLSNIMITQLSLKEIATYFKRKDHTTVIHAKINIESKFKSDPDFRNEIEALISEIRG